MLWNRPLLCLQKYTYVIESWSNKNRNILYITCYILSQAYSEHFGLMLWHFASGYLICWFEYILLGFCPLVTTVLYKCLRMEWIEWRHYKIQRQRTYLRDQTNRPANSCLFGFECDLSSSRWSPLFTMCYPWYM